MDVPTRCSPIEDLTIVFSGVNALFQAFDQIQGRGIDFVIVTDVSRADFKRLDAERERRGRRFRFGFFHSERTLDVGLHTFAHEVTHHTLYSIIEGEIDQRLGPGKDFLPYSQTTMTGPDGSAREADRSGGPSYDDIGASHWQTLVLEAGMSQSLASLRKGMRWWFTASQHQVKVVLLIKLDSARRQVLIEKYVEQDMQAEAESGSPQLAPVLQQSITIDPIENSEPTTYHATGGPLLLEHALLFPGEQGHPDVVVRDDQLARVARRARLAV